MPIMLLTAPALARKLKQLPMLKDNYQAYPQNCPPSNAVGVNSKIYCYVRHYAPFAEDSMATAYQLDKFKNACQCQRRSISCGVSFVYLTELAKRYPFFYDYCKAEGTVSQLDGVLKQTTNHIHHYSFWIDPSSIANFHLKFKLI